MKLSTGKRIGQSGQELLTAAIFSFVLHACAFAAVALFYISTSPRVSLPPSYQVKLVRGPAAAPVTSAPSQEAASAPKTPAPAAHQQKPAPMPKHAAAKQQHKAPAPRPAARGAMPELSKAKPKPEKHEPERAVEPHEQAAVPPAAAAGSGHASSSAGVKSASGAVTTSGGPQDFNQKFEYYLQIVSNKISQNWKPTPDAPDAQVHVTFKLNRSGWAGEVNIVEAQTKATYGFKLAAIRAIQMSNPFPQLPDDFGRQTLELTVDLKAQE